MSPCHFKEEVQTMKKTKTLAKSSYKRRDNIAGYLMLSPWLFGFILMWMIPMVISIYYSLTDFNLLNTPSFIGLDNYVRAFTQDKTFYQALKVTFLYVLILVPLRLAFALFVAMLLNKNHKEKYGALIFGDIYPFPKKRLEEMASKVKQVINVEQNATGQLADLIREQTGILCSSSILKYDGRQISGEEIAERLSGGGMNE